MTVNTTEWMLRVPGGRRLLHTKAAMLEALGRSELPDSTGLKALPAPLQRAVRRRWTLLLGRTPAAGDAVCGMMRPAERVALTRYASQIEPGTSAVELGAHCGVGTCFLAAGLQYAGATELWAVDTFMGTTTLDFERDHRARDTAAMGGSALPIMRRNLEMFGHGRFVRIMPGYTTEVAGQYGGSPIGLLLVDADHSYESCRDDFAAWAPHLANNAIVLFHDYEPNYPGVIRAVDELIDAGRVELVETICTLKACRATERG